MKFLKSPLIVATLLLLSFSLGSCTKEEMVDHREMDYGYVQFKLYKMSEESKAVKALPNPLKHLADAKKVTVNMTFNGESMSQTLTLDATSEAAAEFGLRSQKLQLIPGQYRVDSFVLYDALDKKCYTGTYKEEEKQSFEVVAGGLQVHNLFANTLPGGYVRFTLKKADRNRIPQTKAVEREYTFDEIKTVDIAVKDKNSDPHLPSTVYKGLKAKFSIHFDYEEDLPEKDDNNHQTSTILCDSLICIPGGDYEITSYRVYDADKDLLEAGTGEQVDFHIADNALTKADVVVSMHESPAYIKDYLALEAIWKALDGENWYYEGESMPKGCNWNFEDKDMDLWGDQPGVSLHGNGRVAVINISDFGFKGNLPDEIGDLTEMVELYLGSHNDLNLFDTDFIGPEAEPGLDRMSAHKKYYAQLHPATPFSEPIARGLMEHHIDIPEIAMYKTLKEDQIINKSTGEPIIRPMDTKPGKICNGLESISPAIGKLTKLEKLFIANGKLKELPESMASMDGLTDIEIYNCPEMKKFPMVLSKMKELVALNLANNPQWSSEEVEKGFRAICNGEAKENIQIWYMGFNNMTVFPKEIKNLKKIGLLDLSYNKISKIEAMLGPEIKFVNLGLSNNRITDESWPANPSGEIFFGFDDLEGLTMSHNGMKTFPNIFTSKLNYFMKSVDFSFNDIQKFPEDFKGINVETLVLANNPNLKELTDVFAKSGSAMSMLNLRGCGISKIDPGAFVTDDPSIMANLVSLDLSYNHLTELPSKTFHSGNLPYLFGVDVSYNRFSHFPHEVFDFDALTVMAIRGQRNQNGERCLSEWPDGYAEKNWRGFYIGSNDLRKIDDQISSLCYNLDISDNPRIVFDASDICGAIKAGMFILIYDKTQDIRNCPELLN